MAWPAPVKDRKTGRITGWRIKYRIGKKEGPPSTVFHTKAEALLQEPKFQALEDAGKELTGTNATNAKTLLELAHRYVAFKEQKKKLLPEYREQRLYDLTFVINEGGWVYTSDVTKQSVLDWQDKKNGRGARRGAYLRGLLKWASDNLDQAVEAKALLLLKPADSQTTDIPRQSPEQIAAWRAKAIAEGPHAEALFHLLLYFGGRCVSLARMLVSDYNPFAGTLTHRKVKHTNHDITHPVDPVGIALLNRISAGRKPDEALFLSPITGQPWTAKTKGGKGKASKTPITNWWRDRIDNRTGFQIRNLKYEAITHMIELGMRGEQIAFFTGHKTLAVIERYIRKYDMATKHKALTILFPTNTGSPDGSKMAANDTTPPDMG